MPANIKTQQVRDKREKDLKTLKEQIKIMEQTAIRQDFHYTEKLEQYQQWKKDNDCPGIHF
jgi:hypothetical protein